MSKKRISYFMDSNIGGYYYGQHHPMKPHRLSMTHNLTLAYGTLLLSSPSPFSFFFFRLAHISYISLF